MGKLVVSDNISSKPRRLHVQQLGVYRTVTVRTGQGKVSQSRTQGSRVPDHQFEVTVNHRLGHRDSESYIGTMSVGVGCPIFY